MFKSINTILLFLLLTACSNEQIFNMVKENRYQECVKQTPQRQDECRATHAESYSEYQQDKSESGL